MDKTLTTPQKNLLRLALETKGIVLTYGVQQRTIDWLANGGYIERRYKTDRQALLDLCAIKVDEAKDWINNDWEVAHHFLTQAFMLKNDADHKPWFITDKGREAVK